MFGLILLSAGTAMHLYVFRHAASIPFVRRYVSRKVIFSSGIILWAGFFLTCTIGHGGNGTIAGLLEIFGMNWMAILFLASVCLFAADIITGFGYLLPRITPLLRGWALAAGAALSMIALIQGLRPPVVRDFHVAISDLPVEMENKKIIAMSDLHLGSVLGKSWLEARVTQIESLRPDLVVMMGDLFEGHGDPPPELVETLGRLWAPMGVWAVPGNHESHGNQDKILSLFDKAHISMLSNRWVGLRPGLILAGVKNMHSHQPSDDENIPIEQLLSGRPPGAKILLSHAPVNTEAAAAAGVDLMLCGHTHSGQIWPFGYLVRLSYPLLQGEYKINDMTVIVTRGAGTWGPRMRLWHPGEILRITLHTDIQTSGKGGRP